MAQHSKNRKRVWCRLYEELVDDPKLQMLPANLFKTVINVWCLAIRSRGVLPPVQEMAWKLHVSIEDMQQQFDELVTRGLIDVTCDKNGVTTASPHNWKERQFESDTSKERTRKYRERVKESKRHCDVTTAVTVTAPENRIQITDKEDKAAAVVSELPRAKAALPSVTELQKLSDRLLDAASPCLASQAIAPGLAAMTDPQIWLEQGCDLERDVLPAIRAVLARGKTGIASWSYFTKSVAENRARRLAGLPAVQIKTERERKPKEPMFVLPADTVRYARPVLD